MDTGSPIEARLASSGFVYSFVAFFVVAAIILAVLYFLYLKYKAFIKSKQWIEANKNRETKFSDVRKIAHEANLDRIEKKLLWSICKTHHARNIQFSYRSKNEMQNLFKSEFQRMNLQNPRNEEKISVLFSLRYKLEKLYDRKHSITSTKYLRPGQQIRVLDEKHIPHDATVQKNTPEGFYVEISAELKNFKPKPLSKFMINFSSATGMLYQCVVIAARYEDIPNGKELLLITHSSTLKLIQKRMTKRQGTTIECLFSAVKEVKSGRKTKFEVQQKKYTGTFIDISAGGCKISCGLPISKNQYIQLYFKLPGIIEHQAQGLIIKSKKSVDEKTFVLYIKFTDINIAARNDIYAAIYDYF